MLLRLISHNVSKGQRWILGEVIGLLRNFDFFLQEASPFEEDDWIILNKAFPGVCMVTCKLGPGHGVAVIAHPRWEGLTTPIEVPINDGVAVGLNVKIPGEENKSWTW